MIKLDHISKYYRIGNEQIYVLDNINIEIKKGEFVAIMGPSGSGKTTLLNICGCMDRSSEGKLYINNEDVLKYNEKEIAKLRNTTLSFVFQNFALMEAYNGYENIELPLINRKERKKIRKEKIEDISQKLGITNELKKLPRQMSGGQQQRVAIARALVSGAEIILADEPTGALDYKTGQELMDLLVELNNNGKTIIIVTHDINVAKHAGRIVYLKDGKMEERND